MYGGREEPHMELTGRQIRISVRNLVEFVLRSGDIDNRRTAGAQKEAMLAGGRMHRKIQRRMGSGYQAEVSLRHSVEEDGFQIVVEGRADGIIRDGKDVTIDEIKCVYQDVTVWKKRLACIWRRRAVMAISMDYRKRWTK